MNAGNFVVEGKSQRLAGNNLIINVLDFAEATSGEGIQTRLTINNINNALAAQFEVGKTYTIDFAEVVTE